MSVYKIDKIYWHHLISRKILPQFHVLDFILAQKLSCIWGYELGKPSKKNYEISQIVKTSLTTPPPVVLTLLLRTRGSPKTKSAQLVEKWLRYWQ